MSTATVTHPSPATGSGKVSQWTVRALDARTGDVVVEKLDAIGVEDIKGMLTLRNLTFLDAKPAGRGLQMEIPGLKKRVKAEDLAVFSRMFATMIASGMPLLRALTVITRQTENPTLKDVLDKVTASVQGGRALSTAMAEHPTTFPPLMVNMVRAGEVGGFLDTALRQIAESTEADVKLRSEIKSASTYPLVTLILGLVGGIAMLVFIVPIFASMFTDLGGTLPLPTRIVMGMADFAKIAVVPAIPLTALFVWWWRRNKHTEAVRSRVDPIILKIKVFGPLAKKIALARFCRNLSVMISSGVNLLEALSVVGETCGNVVLRDTVNRAAEHVRQGKQLSAHLGDGGVFPDMVVQMVAVGEESGATDEMLMRISEFYDQQVEATTKRLSSLLEPLLVVFMGVFLGGLIVAMYLPTFAVFDLIQ